MWFLLFSDEHNSFHICHGNVVGPANVDGLIDVRLDASRHIEAVSPSRIFPDDISARTALLIANSQQPQHHSSSGLMNHRSRPTRFQR